MAPKQKKTKEEIELERARKAEEARLAEEERQRQEEEARRIAQQQEEHRQQLLQQLTATRDARLLEEREEVEPYLHQLAADRQHARQRRLAELDWQRHLSCTHLPDPHTRSAMNDYYSTLEEVADSCMEAALQGCQSCLQLAEQCSELALEQKLSGTQGSPDAAAAAVYQEDVQLLWQHISRRLDAATAATLHRADEHANEKGDILLEQVAGPLSWGLWVNTSKNPRFKLLELSQLGVSLEIPKQIALANIALRVQHRPYDQYLHCCTNQYMALGGVLQVDLLMPSPPAQKRRGWLVRQVTPLAYHVQPVPYPIPPAGADHATWQPEEEPPPFSFSLQLDPELLLPSAGEAAGGLRVGWWDGHSSCWSEQGVSGVAYDAARGTLSFSSLHLGPLALLADRTRLLPYRAWCIHPTGSYGGSSVKINLEVGLSEPVVLSISPGTAQLLSPQLPQLAGLLGQALPPWVLLQQLSRQGVHLLPEDRDAAAMGWQVKAAAAEEAMCEDLAGICTAFLVASSRWNQGLGPATCCCRLSEVLDWEEGGRTEPHHVAAVFAKERQEGPRRVLTVARQGSQGVMFLDAPDRADQVPQLPSYTTLEAVQAAGADAYGHLHHNLLCLLKGPHPDVAGHPRAAELAATPEGLEHARGADAVLSETVALVLRALRLFSFS